MDKLALAAILVSFIGAGVIPLLPQKAAKWVCQAGAAIAFLFVLILTVRFGTGGTHATTTTLLSVGDIQVFGLTVDSLSVLIGFAVVFIGFLITVYSGAYLNAGNREHPDSGRRRYYAFLLAFIGAMAGLVFSSTIIGQLVFFEITGACSWGLIGYYEKPRALRSAMKALLVTHLASIGLYVAAAYLLLGTGSFALAGMAGLGDTAKVIVLFGILIAAWGKSAQLPFHVWLPDAMEAPTPISAYLHAASMVKVGVYIFARAIASSGEVPPVVGIVGATMAVVTLIYGFVMYLPQKDLKRLLAYSTITQLSYIFLALSLASLGSELAFKGAIAHIFNHAFAKTLFFLVAGALSYTCGTRMLPSLRGIMKRMPLVGIAFCVAALAITGVPPFNGFFSKFVIFAGGFEVSGQHLLILPLIVLAMIESIGSFAWFLRWVGFSVPGPSSTEVATAAPLPVAMQVVLVTLVIMSVCSSFIAASWLG
ncbi:hydrogenase 4 subunit D [Azospirillum halopraeferens]|uniref:hydrogenase 4 subunit D n=1 Tax=Azospirillum halopraeferens TaxID=34010 RepID=UPI000421BEFD|nr:hydrogenase 4 subunit D [Azospirillum halopraeferens]